MLNKKQFQDLIERTLESLGLGGQKAVMLLLGTAAQESKFGTELRQIGGGPALGFFQMEPATERDIWRNFLAYRPDLRRTVIDLTGRSGPGPWLEYDIVYQIIMARLRYYRVTEPLPDTSEASLGRYWKEHYNTQGGAGTVKEFIENFNRYVGG